ASLNEIPERSSIWEVGTLNVKSEGTEETMLWPKEAANSCPLGLLPVAKIRKSQSIGLCLSKKRVNPSSFLSIERIECSLRMSTPPLFAASSKQLMIVAE